MDAAATVIPSAAGSRQQPESSAAACAVMARNGEGNIFTDRLP
jgi:hypothetical protein